MHAVHAQRLNLRRTQGAQRLNALLGIGLAWPRKQYLNREVTAPPTPSPQMRLFPKHNRIQISSYILQSHN